jgi:hypothetical protein
MNFLDDRRDTKTFGVRIQELCGLGSGSRDMTVARAKEDTVSDRPTRRLTNVPDPNAPAPDILARLSPETQAKLTEYENRINGRIANAVRGTLENGQDFNEVKEMELPHGVFGAWIKRNCRVGQKTVERWMKAAKNCAGKFDILSNLPIEASTLCLFTIEEALEEAIEKAQSGQKIGMAAAKAIVEKHGGTSPPSRASAKSKTELRVVSSRKETDGETKSSTFYMISISGDEQLFKQLAEVARRLGAGAENPGPQRIEQVKSCAAEINDLVSRLGRGTIH